MTSNNQRPAADTGPRPPWILVDNDVVDHSAAVLDRLTRWLTSEDLAAGRCARALSLGETDDPISIASWTDALAARLHRRAQEATIH